eukprot:NODE_364_length_1587_cov_97.660274_g332_i0.p1 GENE.NODE_364_length_1587_cov_97.660274_g332_i0~~NODE_364_length_1587_cov_97.660274_g332_i0.p1  ORF type:complete len:426 (-),score=87.23 NODE_364_length_1587_cov_97.660274_g332_i0:138-1415(-)
MPLASRSPKKQQEKSAKASRSEFACRPADNGMNEWTFKQQKFVLPSRYEPIAKLGSGSYGLVISAKDRITGDKVAIKRCGNVFKHCEDGKRVLREIKMMSMLEHRNVLPIKDVFVTSRDFHEVYVVTPCLDTDLQQLIRSYKLSEQHVKYIMYQVLRSLKYVHSARVLHRDLKPANILINFDCHVKLCDFGLARGYDPQNKPDMTSYIVTRWYRAPELLLQNSQYNSAIDIWAAGCLFAEMLIGKPLFCGESSIEQLKLICDTIPIPAQDELWWVQSSKMRSYLVGLRQGKENGAPGKDLKTILGSKANAVAMDMIQKMLCFNPADRWSAEALLDHPFLASIRTGRHHSPATQRFKWRWDCITNLTEPQLRQLYWQEILRWHPECPHIPSGTRPATPVAFDVADRADTKERERDRDDRKGMKTLA